MKHITIIMAALLAIASCAPHGDSGDFTQQEIEIIEEADSIMRVLTIEASADVSVLRAKSTDLSPDALLSPAYASLAELMVATVTHPSQDGVGIAGPQVGLNRRVVAVQRFDKEGEPFEVYPNIRIIWASDSLEAGPEGCLSVPNRRGEVMRSTEIVIEYADIQKLKEIYQPYKTSGNALIDNNTDTGTDSRNGWNVTTPMVRDTVRDFTAVIFQHEIDHLDGVLYIDRL